MNDFPETGKRIQTALRTSWKVDWVLLLFLLLFLNVKVEVKVAATVLVYLLRRDFRFAFRWKGSRLPLFYPVIIGIAVLNGLLLHAYSSMSSAVVLLTGIGFWGLCILAVHQVKLSVERNDTETLHHTLLVFFLLNAFVSMLNLGLIVLETHAANPYLYQGMFQKYFLRTGDYIKGISFDTSTTNAIINAMGLLYFLTRKQYGFALVCMAILLLTVSNFTNLVLVLLLSAIFLLRSNRDQKSIILVCGLLLVVFMARVSPQNNRYVVETFSDLLHRKKSVVIYDHKEIPIWERPDSVLSTEEKRVKIAYWRLDSMSKATKPDTADMVAAADPVPATVLSSQGTVQVPRPDINGPYYQHRNDTTTQQSLLVRFIKAHAAALPLATEQDAHLKLPGKVTAVRQTLQYLEAHPAQWLTGNGAGRFSSMLAFRATGLKIAGGFPERFTTITPGFLSNHLDLYLYYFTHPADMHSIANTPDSVYDQLLAEYGLLGILAFAAFYAWFWWKRRKAMTYGLPLLFLVGCLFATGYWFEQLSVVVLFELLLFLDIKEHSQQGFSYAQL